MSICGCVRYLECTRTGLSIAASAHHQCRFLKKATKDGGSIESERKRTVLLLATGDFLTRVRSCMAASCHVLARVYIRSAKHERKRSCAPHEPLPRVICVQTNNTRHFSYARKHYVVRALARRRRHNRCTRTVFTTTIATCINVHHFVSCAVQMQTDPIGSAQVARAWAPLSQHANRHHAQPCLSVSLLAKAKRTVCWLVGCSEAAQCSCAAQLCATPINDNVQMGHKQPSTGHCQLPFSTRFQ